MQILSIIYISTTIIFTLFNIPELIPTASHYGIFYMGYTTALMQKLLDFRAFRFLHISAFSFIFTVLKFSILRTTDPLQVIMIAFLELFPIILSFKSEKADRMLYHRLFQSKNQLLKFKQFMTDYLPNQIAILSRNLDVSSFLNTAFRKSFNCEGILELKTSLQRLVLEDHEVEKHRDLFALINFPITKEIRFLSLLDHISKNLHSIKDLELMSFQVYEQTMAQYIKSFHSRKKDKKNTGGALFQENNFPSDRQFLDVKYSFQSITMDKLNEDIYVKRSGSTTPFQKDFPGALITPISCSPEFSEDEASISQEEDKQGSDTITKRSFKIKIIPLIWDNEESIGLVLDDVTHERTIMELKIADKNKDLVIAMVSHELRTPLNGMLGILDIMKKILKQPDVLPYLTACRNSSLMLLNLVNSILDFSQIKKNKLQLVYSNVPILEFLNEIKSLFSHFSMVKGIFLNIEVDPDVPEMINTDETRLRQVLINLVGNAFKFTFKGGVTIKVGLESFVPLKVKFTVEDTGIGIKKEDQEKLFKLFGRLEQKDKKINTHGVGLGLTISNTLVLLLNSSEKRGIQVASEYEKGTAFSFVVQSGPKLKNADRDTPLANKIEESCTVLDQERKESETILEKLSSYPEKTDLAKFGTSSRTKSKHLISNIESKDSIPPTPGTPMKLSHFNSTESIQDSYIAKYKKQPNHLFSTIHRGTPTNKSRFQEQSELQVEKPKPICLIVDDNPFNLIVATNIMQEKGYVVKTALNGQEAIDRVKFQQEDKPNQQFSLILMDCQMPVMDGYEATRNLTKMMKDGEVSEITIIALTANQRDEEHDKHCFEVGMKGVLGKPLDVEELKEILKKITKNCDENN